MRTKFFSSVFCLLLSLLPASSLLLSADESLDQFISQMQEFLKAHEENAYLNLFAPELQESQRKNLSRYFERLKMEDVSLFQASRGIPQEEGTKVYCQVLFQNATSALIEIWELMLTRKGEGWQVQNHVITGTLANLCKIKIPAERQERVAFLEIEHADIKLTFRNSLVFYDNIPDIETALLVIGDGQLAFSPSDSEEKHQLELIYKKRALEEKLEYAFLRFSPAFFKKNIKIQNAESTRNRPVTGAELNKASTLFTKHYLRYFTIENSLSREPLSFLPQGDETVMEFEGKKIGEFTYIYSPFGEEEISFYDQRRQRYVNLYSPITDENTRRFFISFGQKFDATNYQIELDFDPKQSYLSAKAKVDVVSHVGTLENVKFKFNPELEILRIYDDQKRELFYSQDRATKAFYIYFCEPPEKDQTASIEVYYRGHLEPPPLAADVFPGPRHRNTRIFNPKNFETYLFTESAYWYPAPPDEDYFRSQIKIITPPDYTCLATGELREQGKLIGMQRVTEIDKVGSTWSLFETKKPVKYLSFLVGKLDKIQEFRDPLPLEFFISADNRYQRRNLTEETQKILQFFESLFGPFPYGNLRVIQRLWSTRGGHSPASLIILDEIPRFADSGMREDVMENSNSPVDLSQWKEYFLAHEIAHQWWGQGVTWGRYRDQWLSEGMAQFSAVLYLKNKYNRRAFSSILKKFSKWTEKKSVWGPITLGSRLSFFDFQAYQAITYDKPVLVLNMLQDLLGDSLFFNGLKEFFSAHQYSAARTGDFIKMMEKVSGRDLKDFFGGWFGSHLLPRVRVSHFLEKEGNSYRLRFKIEQLEKNFVFPLWIQWEEQGKAVSQKVIITAQTQEFEFTPAARPEKIKINPDRAVPGKFF